MGIYTPFERDFIQRTLNIIEQYDKYIVDNPDIEEKEKYNVTLLINCLLGLLILPKERLFISLPNPPIVIKDLYNWGIKEEFIKNLGTKPPKLDSKHYDSLGELVYKMRNSVGHMNIKASGNSNVITRIEFKDDFGFELDIPVGSLKIFVTKLATQLLNS